MPFEVNYDQENDCVIGRLTGVIDRQTITDQANEASRVVSQWNCARILNDLQGAEPAISTMGIFSIPEELQRVGLGPGDGAPVLKRAIVVSGDSESLQDYRFFINTAKNGGLDIELFTDMDEAMSWLKGDF